MWMWIMFGSRCINVYVKEFNANVRYNLNVNRANGNNIGGHKNNMGLNMNQYK